MVRHFVQMMLVLAVAATAACAQGTPQRMWYRGPFDGWVEAKTGPQPGYYYQPSPDPVYPLHEQAYGQPIYCQACGHMHYPGQDVCPYCGRKCPAGGNHERPSTVYSPYALPGQYYFEEQPHYRFASPMRLGPPYQKYDRTYDLDSH